MSFYAKYPVTGSGTSGTVTSVGLADASTSPLFAISGSPVTSSGTLTLTLNTQSANTVFSGPASGASAQPNFRHLVVADMPNLSGVYVTQSEVGQPNGVASLDGSGKVPSSQLPSTVLEYQGLWNPTTNTPTLQDSTGTNGFVYQVSAVFAGPIAGLNNTTMVNFQVGNLVIYSGTLGQWEQAAALTGVTSVNGAVGAVTVNAINQLTGDVTAGPASQSQSQTSTVAKIQGTAVSGTTGSTNVVFSASPTLTGTLTAANITASGTLLPSVNGTQDIGSPSFTWNNGYFQSLSANSRVTAGSLFSNAWFNSAGTHSLNWSGGTLSGDSDLSVTLGSAGVRYVNFFSAAAVLGAFKLNASPSAGFVLTSDASGNGSWAAPATSGTVTSVAMTVPSFLSISGSPITSSGTLALSLSGTALPVTSGGTGDTSFTAYSVVCGGTTSTGALQNVSGVGTTGQVLTSNGAAALPTWQTSTAPGVTTSYTPTIVGNGTVSNLSAFYVITGDRMVGQISYTTGTCTATTWSISLPGGHSIDYTKLSTVSNIQSVGDAYQMNGTSAYAGSNGPAPIFADGSSTTTLFLAAAPSGGVFAKTNGNGWFNNNVGISINFNIPVT